MVCRATATTSPPTTANISLRAEPPVTTLTDDQRLQIQTAIHGFLISYFCEKFESSEEKSFCVPFILITSLLAILGKGLGAYEDKRLFLSALGLPEDISIDHLCLYVEDVLKTASDSETLTLAFALISKDPLIETYRHFFEHFFPNAKTFMTSDSLIDAANRFCQKATEGRITDLLAQQPADLSVASALTMDRKWMIPFCEANPNGFFSRPDGSLARGFLSLKARKGFTSTVIQGCDVVKKECEDGSYTLFIAQKPIENAPSPSLSQLFKDLPQIWPECFAHSGNGSAAFFITHAWSVESEDSGLLPFLKSRAFITPNTEVNDMLPAGKVEDITYKVQCSLSREGMQASAGLTAVVRYRPMGISFGEHAVFHFSPEGALVLATVVREDALIFQPRVTDLHPNGNLEEISWKIVSEGLHLSVGERTFSENGRTPLILPAHCKGGKLSSAIDDHMVTLNITFEPESGSQDMRLRYGRKQVENKTMIVGSLEKEVLISDRFPPEIAELVVARCLREQTKSFAVYAPRGIRVVLTTGNVLYVNSRQVPLPTFLLKFYNNILVSESGDTVVLYSTKGDHFLLARGDTLEARPLKKPAPLTSFSKVLTKVPQNYQNFLTELKLPNQPVRFELMGAKESLTVINCTDRPIELLNASDKMTLVSLDGKFSSLGFLQEVPICIVFVLDTEGNVHVYSLTQESNERKHVKMIWDERQNFWKFSKLKWSVSEGEL